MADKRLVVLWVDEELSRDRPLRVELRRRGARVLMARSAERAFELSELFAVQVVVLFDESLAAHFRSAFPAMEIILLTSGPGEGLQGVGLGLLYSGSRPLALETMLVLLDAAFPGRLDRGVVPRSPPATVLCVDDDPEMLRSLSRLLLRRGYRPRPLSDPLAALETIPQVSPDLAILDVTMPGLDGCELARQIRSVYRNLIPLVMLSARSSGADIAAGYQHGANAYLSKPCPPDRLMDVVDYYAGDLDIEEFEALESEGKSRGWKSMGAVRSEVNP